MVSICSSVSGTSLISLQMIEFNLCYDRWILIAFKREFNFDDVLRLWEVLWTDYYSNSFLLFVALAVLESHRDVILRYLVEVGVFTLFGLACTQPICQSSSMRFSRSVVDNLLRC